MTRPLRHVPAETLDANTPQTEGMRRLAAISHGTVGSEALFVGRTHMDPDTSSGPHHHGESESAIYVVAGNPVFVFREDGREVRIETKPGDFVYVPPFVPHVEENRSDTEAVVVVHRTTQEAIVENLPHL